MKHAGPQALAELTDLLARIRRLPGLVEKRPGVFYRRSEAFLHFHEDPTGLFADLRLAGADFERLPLTRPEERERLIALLQDALG